MWGRTKMTMAWRKRAMWVIVERAREVEEGQPDFEGLFGRLGMMNRIGFGNPIPSGDLFLVSNDLRSRSCHCHPTTDASSRFGTMLLDDMVPVSSPRWYSN